MGPERPQLSGMTKPKSPFSESTTQQIADATGDKAPESGPSSLGSPSQHSPATPRYACVIPRPGEAPVCGELVESTGQPLGGNKDER